MTNYAPPTPAQINAILASPTMLARRLNDLPNYRYVSDQVLTGRYSVSGGAIQYETGESIFTNDAPLAVTPGAEYPITNVGDGTPSLAKTVKWGQDALVTDEAVKRLLRDPLDRALSKLANQNVKTVDSVAIAAVTSAVSAGVAAGTSWASATAASILKDVLLAKANIAALNQGYNPDTVVVDDLNWAYALSAFTAAGYFAREAPGNNPALTGTFPEIAGLKWLVTGNGISGTALVLDSQRLGGMADEDLGGPGYVKVGGVGTEVKSIRDEETDGWRLRARRVTVPVVIEPAAARKITSL